MALIQEDFLDKLTAIHFPGGDIAVFEIHWEIHSKSMAEILFYPFTMTANDRRVSMNVRTMASVPVFAPPKIQSGQLRWKYPDKVANVDDTFSSTEIIDIARYNIVSSEGTIAFYTEPLTPDIIRVPFKIDWPNFDLYADTGELLIDASSSGIFIAAMQSYMESAFGNVFGFSEDNQWWRQNLIEIVSSHFEGGGVLFGREYDFIFFVNLERVKKGLSTLVCDFKFGPWASEELNVSVLIKCETYKRKNVKRFPVDGQNNVATTDLATDTAQLFGFVTADFPQARGFKFTVDRKTLGITTASRFL